MAYSPYDAYDSYDDYDSYSRPRKQSFGYRATTPVGGYPYDPRLGASYSEPMMRGEVPQYLFMFVVICSCLIVKALLFVSLPDVPVQP